ncbi:MAG: NADH-quinone oxidoreductase subunit I [Acidobacteria bacterium]|nr:NADH-quinone oxidoreductase subunit I [Acidobacteriota bacterium]MCZ6661707.1 NADH-quinone oxidoreductase subunit I [Actinomycetota bacterium]
MAKGNDSRTLLGMGMVKGLAVTITTMFKTIFLPKKHLATVNYPKVKETPVPRARGVIALDQDACTVCMLCARQCPDWCIYIEGHKEEQPPSKPGGRIKVRATLDRFDIDYALCMYCGICVEVCPFDALFWTPEYEYSETQMGEMLHDMDRLQDWMKTVPEVPALEP